MQKSGRVLTSFAGLPLGIATALTGVLGRVLLVLGSIICGLLPFDALFSGLEMVFTHDQRALVDAAGFLAEAVVLFTCDRNGSLWPREAPAGARNRAQARTRRRWSLGLIGPQAGRGDHGRDAAVKSSSTVESASGRTFTEPANGWSMAMITNSPEKIRADSIPVISVWARRFSVPKKNVKLIVNTAPPKSTSQMIPGTMPEPVTSLARRVWVTRSS